MTRPSDALDVGEQPQRGDHPLLVADAPGETGGVDQVLGGAPVRAALEERQAGRLVGRRRVAQPLVGLVARRGRDEVRGRQVRPFAGDQRAAQGPARGREHRVVLTQRDDGRFEHLDRLVGVAGREQADPEQSVGERPALHVTRGEPDEERVGLVDQLLPLVGLEQHVAELGAQAQRVGDADLVGAGHGLTEAQHRGVDVAGLPGELGPGRGDRDGDRGEIVLHGTGVGPLQQRLRLGVVGPDRRRTRLPGAR